MFFPQKFLVYPCLRCREIEMVLEHPIKLRNDTIALYVLPLFNSSLICVLKSRFVYRVWISSDHVGAVAQKGFRLIHAASDFFYLDCGAGDFLGVNVDGNSWCDPFKTWQKSYSFNPTAGLTGNQTKLVLGGTFFLRQPSYLHFCVDFFVRPATLVDRTKRTVQS